MMAEGAVSWSAAIRYLSAGGWLMGPLAVASFAIWYHYLSAYLWYRQHLRFGQFANLPVAPGQSAPSCESLAGVPGAVADMVRRVLVGLAAGLDTGEACRQVREGDAVRSDRSLVVLAAWVAAAPLMGLLGTVLGMMETFEAVGSRSGEAASLVAGGISQALVTTQVGLVAALPGTLGLAHLYRLRRRLLHLLDECELHLSMTFGERPGRETAA